MRALLVYESMFGNTARVAEKIARGLSPEFDVSVSSVNDVESRDIEAVDLLVVGAPTHAFGLSSPATRREAEEWTHDPAKRLTLEFRALQGGVREWLNTVPNGSTEFVAFDTRADHSVVLTGSAARRIAKALASKGFREVAPTHSFLVDRNVVEPEQLERAIEWGQQIALVTMGAQISAR